MPAPMPDLSLESRLHAQGARVVAGVDEVGRGPLAGPVVAAAVVLFPCTVPVGLDDSKKLDAPTRQRLADEVQLCAHIGIGEASVEEIDAINILQATFLAMCRAVDALSVRPDALLIDGNRLPANLPCRAEAVVKGDARSVSISAASIVAKNRRDLGMLTLAQQYPGYGWETNMGYGTREHLLGLKRHGATPIHRRSFRPVHDILFQGNFDVGQVK
ncbi:ribonuclease HII [Palleronia abyssalis]|uniref:Ribonuclease HII n=1 Tax=Palleronia abyssalis TaxID=1501240 RepID=A0A2R8BT77_9RHOB|nr:ribonuclease HII [Palleronia abyssalis]SPJ23286.1 Ribonuclease HII [Palleronia abyssalis]